VLCLSTDYYALNKQADVELILYAVIFPYAIMLMCIAGIACNVFCIVVFSRDQSTNHNTVFLLQMLAVADMIYLFVCIVGHSATIVLVHDVYVNIVIRTLHDIALSVTKWIFVVVAVDRYLIVCRPQLAAKYSSTVCAVWIASVLVHIPQFLEASDLFDRRAYILGYRIGFQLFVCNFLPVSLIITHSAFRAMFVVRNEATTVVDDKRGMTIILNKVAAVFVAIHIISTIIQMYLRGDDYASGTMPWQSERDHQVARMIDGALLVAVSSFKIVFYPKRVANIPVSAAA